MMGRLVAKRGGFARITLTLGLLESCERRLIVAASLSAQRANDDRLGVRWCMALGKVGHGGHAAAFSVGFGH